MIVAIYVICSRKLCAGSIIYNISVLNVILMLWLVFPIKELYILGAILRST